jgi:hypothetical protein
MGEENIQKAVKTVIDAAEAAQYYSPILLSISWHHLEKTTDSTYLPSLSSH